MPILDNIMDHEVLGREYTRGLADGRSKGLELGLEQGREQGRQQELMLLTRLLEKRFGPLPAAALTDLKSRTTAQLLEIGEKLLDAPSLDQLLT